MRARRRTSNRKPFTASSTGHIVAGDRTAPLGAPFFFGSIEFAVGLGSEVTGLPVATYPHGRLRRSPYGGDMGRLILIRNACVANQTPRTGRVRRPLGRRRSMFSVLLAFGIFFCTCSSRGRRHSLATPR